LIGSDFDDQLICLYFFIYFLFCLSSSVTNRVIGAKDHASVQINVGEVDETGRYTGSYKTYALCGFIRKQGEGDDALTRLCVKDGVINKNYHS